MRMNYRFSAIFISLALLLGAVPVEEARRLFEAARVDRAHGRCSQAVEKLQKVLEIKDTAGVRYQLGLCQFELGRYKEALLTFRVAKLQAEKQNARDVLAVIDTQIEATSTRLATLYISTESPDASVTINGMPVTENPTLLDPGIYTVRAVWSSKVEASQLLTVRAQESQFVTLKRPVPPIASTSPIPRASVSTIPKQVSAYEAKPKPNHVPAIAAYGSGAMLLSAGALSLWQAEKIQKDTDQACVQGVLCDPDRARDMRYFRTAGVSGLVLGAALTGLGVYLTFLPAKPVQQFSVTPLGISGVF